MKTKLLLLILNIATISILLYFSYEIDILKTYIESSGWAALFLLILFNLNKILKTSIKSSVGAKDLLFALSITHIAPIVLAHLFVLDTNLLLTNIYSLLTGALIITSIFLPIPAKGKVLALSFLVAVHSFLGWQQ